MRAIVEILALWLMLGRGAVADGQDLASEATRHIRVEWELQRTKRTPWALCGSVYDDYHIPARHVELLIESLDASGAPTGGSRVFHSVNDVAAGSRAIFCLPVAPGPERYRITVRSVQWGYHEAP